MNETASETTPEETIAALRAENALLREQRDRAQSQLDALLHRLYGRSRERYTDEGYGPLFEGQEPPEPALPPHFDEAPDDEEAPDDKPSRKPRRRGAPRLPADIRRVIEDVEPTADERTCSCCGEAREVIGYEETEKLEYEPASCYLRVIRRPKLACKKHEEAGVKSPDLPRQAVDKGLAGASMLAQVVTAKHCDHLPLYRQARIYARQGIDVPESTLCDWIAQSAELLRPIVDAMAKDVFASGYVSTDDTRVTLLTKAHPKGSKRAHLWAYLGASPGDVVFDFTSGRDGEGPKRMLANYAGILQADAYSVYDQIFRNEKIVEAGCMAHARRKFFDALEKAPEHAKPALQAIRALYAVERECKQAHLSEEARLARRQQESAPTLYALREWLAELRSHVLPKSPIGRAVGYFDRHSDALARFGESPWVAIMRTTSLWRLGHSDGARRGIAGSASPHNHIASGNASKLSNALNRRPRRPCNSVTRARTRPFNATLASRYACDVKPSGSPEHHDEMTQSCANPDPVSEDRSGTGASRQVAIEERLHTRARRTSLAPVEPAREVCRRADVSLDGDQRNVTALDVLYELISDVPPARRLATPPAL